MKRLAPLAALIALAAPASAQGIPDDMARVDLLPGWRTAEGVHMAALRVRLAPGWKTYWRAPGDAGIPPSFDFAGSSNIGAVAFHWPVPEVFSANGMTSVGYSTQLILPIEVRTADPGAARLRAQIDLGVCEDVCVPISVSVSAELPAAPVKPDRQIRAALADRPLSAREAGAGGLTCEIAPARDGVRLGTAMRVPSMGTGEVAVIELGNPDFWVSEADVSRSGQSLSVAADVVAMSGGPVAVDRSTVRVTVIGPKGAVELLGC